MNEGGSKGELSLGLCCDTHKTCTSTLPGVLPRSLSRSGRGTNADVRFPFLPFLPSYTHFSPSPLVPVENGVSAVAGRVEQSTLGVGEAQRKL